MTAQDAAEPAARSTAREAIDEWKASKKPVKHDDINVSKATVLRQERAMIDGYKAIRSNWAAQADAPPPSAPVSPLVAHGSNGDVSFDGEYVEIRRTALRSMFNTGVGVKRIPVSSITSITFKSSGMSYLIVFEFPGSSKVRMTSGLGKHVDASFEENAVTFGPSAVSSFERLRDAARAPGRHRGSPGVGPVHA